jgi:hypothetical protein
VAWIGGCDQAWHREHADSLSARQVDVMVDFHHRRLAYETLFLDGSDDTAENARLLSMARAALADEALARASSAYAKGRGGTAETEGYLEFARSLDVDWSTLPCSDVFRKARSLGPRRARLSPQLVAWAGFRRLRSELGKTRWRTRGI